MKKNIVITRPIFQNRILEEALNAEENNIEILSAPVLDILPLKDSDQLSLVPNPREFDVVIFVSSNAVKHYHKICLSKFSWSGWPKNVIGATVGSSTLKTLNDCFSNRYDQFDFFCPSQNEYQDSRMLFFELQRKNLFKKKILIVRGQFGSSWLSDYLKKNGAEVHNCIVYFSIPVIWKETIWKRLFKLKSLNEYPIWLYTSNRILHEIFLKMKQKDWLDWWRECPSIFIHPSIQKKWEEYIHDYSKNKEILPRSLISKPDIKSLRSTILDFYLEV